MLARLVEIIQTVFGSETRPGMMVDACVECGDPTIPGAGRCGSCLDE
jgi:hypothetical protein